MRLFNEMFMLCVDSVFLAILPSRKAVLCPFIRAMSLVRPFLMKSMQFEDIMMWKLDFLGRQNMDSRLFCSFGM